MRPAQLLGAPAADRSARAVASEPPQRARQATALPAAPNPAMRDRTGARWRRCGRRPDGRWRAPCARSGNAADARAARNNTKIKTTLKLK
eukprot:scaffold20766_cov118-Isochrysis_galbana.AAC.2